MPDFVNNLVSPISGMYGYNQIGTGMDTTMLMNDWRWGLLKRYPNGTAPLYALTALMSKVSTSSDQFKWRTSAMPSMRTDVSGVYSNGALSTAYTGGTGTAGTVVYIALTTAADVALFQPHNVISVGDSADISASVGLQVLSTGTYDGTAYVCAKLLESDDNTLLTSGGSDLADADFIQYMGNAFPHGSVRPEALSFGAKEYYNNTQIFRNAAEATANALIEPTFSKENAWNNRVLDAFMLHSTGIEWALLMGVGQRGTGDNGQPLNTTDGIITYLHNNVPDNYCFFNLDTDTYYKGQTWIDRGIDWIATKMAQAQRYNDSYNSRLAYIGENALQWIQRAVKANGDYTMVAGTMEFGINVRRLITPFGDLDFQIHPLFSRHPGLTNSILVLEPRNLIYRYLEGRDTKLTDANTGLGSESGRDAKVAAYLTECGLEIHNPDTFLFLGGIGQDNHLV